LIAHLRSLHVSAYVEEGEQFACVSERLAAARVHVFHESPQVVMGSVALVDRRPDLDDERLHRRTYGAK
jgi:hypothetical protein